jgi:thiamine-monophosphate kinase
MPSPEEHAQRGERALIARLADLLETPTLAGVPFGDDMAGIDPSGLLATTDMLMDGVDFAVLEHDLGDIGYKSLAVNLSDCAAMGAVPQTALVAVALPDAFDMNAAERLMAGIHRCGREFGCTVVGGDTNSWPQPLVVSITVFARPLGPRPICRAGARVGDRVYLSGAVGGSILGRHLRPRPRLDLLEKLLAPPSPSAMIDISDGVAVDLGHVLSASDVGAELDQAALERAIHPDALTLSQRDGRPALEHALHDGEDFELLFTHAGLAAATTAELGLFEVGRIVAGTGIEMVRPDGGRCVVEQIGWEHFR